MGWLGDKLKGELIDIIEWTDSTQDTMVYRFERHGNEIKMGAKLTVRESQAAVFVNEGKFADVFAPGMHTLTTQNIPILSTLQGWKHGFNSPFKAEVYFVNTKNFTDQKWGTKNAITIDDPRFGMVEIRAFGTFATRITDPKAFLTEIAGTDGQFTTDEVYNQLRSLVVSRFTDTVAESGITAEKFAAKLDELSVTCLSKMASDFGEYGLSLSKFLIENISMPDEIKKEIFELSRLDKIDIQKLQQLKTAKAIEKAAENPSGTAGAGIGMGMGFAMANQMGQAMSPQTTAPATSPPPPPLPASLEYFVAVNGQQSGPFNQAVLTQMISAGQITRESLVWKQGLAAWVKAAEAPEVAKLFASVPPPMPS